MKNTKISSFIFILIVIFLLINAIGYKLLHDSMQSNHEKDTKILFHKIKDPSANLLVKLIHHYEIEKSTLLQKHKTVQTYLNYRDLNISLDEIHQKINAGYQNRPYNIYITDKNLTIRNTTYKADLNFNLGFAKKSFEKHKSQNIIGCSFPIREMRTSKFLSYADSYIAKKDDERAAILQVSYTYENMGSELSDIKAVIDKHEIIRHMNAYSFGQEDFSYDMMIKNDPAYEHSGNELTAVQKKAQKLSQKLHKNDLIVENFSKNGTHYQRLYMSTQSPISKNLKIVYTLLLDDDSYYTRLNRLNLFILFSIVLGIIGIFIIAKVRDKEIMLSDQDTFIQSAMHEIKTPLSIITLNNELRELEQGTDTYSKEINNALKVLHNSYRSMSFIMTKDKLVYEIETLNLSHIVKQRIEYFQAIAHMNDKKIIFDINSNYMVNISLIELTRLIDNSLYNAIKYSAAGSQIKVVLINNILSFHNKGDAIENKEKVFHKYFRENKTVGGYGLGLSIIKDIAEKYDINIELESDTDNGTTFTYSFKEVKKL